MLLNIKPIKSSANCYTNNLIIQVCDYYGREYVPFFLRYFNDCLSAKNLSNDLLASDPSISLATKYPCYNLIGFSYSRQYDIKDYKKFIVSQLEAGFPVGLCIDGEHLHWSVSDKSVNRMILVVGYDEDKNSYICADGYFSSEYQYLSEQELCNNSAILSFSSKTDFILELSGLCEAILYGYTNATIEIRKKEMTEYVEYINSQFITAVKYLQYKDITTTPFIYNLSHFVSNRNYFYDALSFINQKYGDVLPDNVVHDVFDLSEKWNVYKNLMVKCTITQNQNALSKADSVFHDIINMESVVMNKIIEYKNK